jgi:hypothetical protein
MDNLNGKKENPSTGTRRTATRAAISAVVVVGLKGRVR